MTAKRITIIVAIGSILVLLLVRGVIPAITTISTDFPNYYTSSRLLVEGSDPARFYDTEWFQEQINRFGMPVQGKFSPFPPATALIYIPFALLSPEAAMKMVTLVNILLLALCGILLQRIFRVSSAEAFLFMLLSGIGLVNCIRFGQMYIAVSAGMIVTYYLYLKDKPGLAGLALGVFVPIKYFPMVLILSFFMKKEWRVVLSSIGASVIVVMIGIVVMGWEIHQQFLFQEAGLHLAANLELQNPFSSTYQSWDSLLRTLFLYDADLNPLPFVESQQMFLVSKTLILLLIVAVTTVLIYRNHKLSREPIFSLDFALLSFAALLLAPATATYHYVLLWLPVGLVLRFLQDGKRVVELSLILFFYASIGFIPYSIFRNFEGLGGHTVVAYPRLFLVCCLYLLTAIAILRNPARRLDARTFTGKTEPFGCSTRS